MVEIPNSSIDRIIRKGGAKRVSKSAIKVLSSELEDYGVEISKIAWEMAKYAGKKTVEDKDIQLALMKIKKH
ncbi:MAG: histone family protein [Candidatus Hodarchaeales archaeon]